VSTQKEQCQICGAEKPRSSLVRKLMPIGYRAGANYFLYSSYNSAFWEMATFTDADRVSMGCYVDRFRPRVVEDATTEANGSQTWSGSASGTAASGLFRTIVATDISSLTNVYFSLMIGPYHAQADQTISAVAMGLCDSTGVTKYEQKTYGSLKGQRLYWFSSAVAGLDAGITTTAAYFYVTLTIRNLATGADFWLDHMSLEDSTSPTDARRTTSGAQSIKATDGFSYQMPILCPDCANEKLIKPSEKYGKFRQAEWVEIKNRTEGL